MSLDDERERLAKQLDFLASELSRIEALVPTDKELEELRKIKLERERSTWLWQMIRTYVPWIVGIGGPLVSAVWWLASHFTWTPPKP